MEHFRGSGKASLKAHMDFSVKAPRDVDVNCRSPGRCVAELALNQAGIPGDFPKASSIGVPQIVELNPAAGVLGDPIFGSSSREVSIDFPSREDPALSPWPAREQFKNLAGETDPAGAMRPAPIISLPFGAGSIPSGPANVQGAGPEIDILKTQANNLSNP